MNNDFSVWLWNILERAGTSFVQAILALLTVESLTAFDTNVARKLATAGLVAAASTFKAAMWPDNGFGWPFFKDLAARAAFTGVFAGAATIAASTGFDLFSVTAWQTVWVSVVAAALAVVKGALVRSRSTITAASAVPVSAAA